MGISNDFLNSLVKQKCEKCGREDIGIVITSDNRKLCFECDKEEKRIVIVKMSDEVKSIIRDLSLSLNLSISSIFRSILTIYKDKSEIVKKISEDDYSKALYVNMKKYNDVEYQQYQEYADRISNQDILDILKDILEKVDREDIVK
ncbi:hypothetical protein FDB50_15385 [Clostridium botulinum]|uniref:Uncharacterized protein n=1 Tax=Clostridium botulinum TaxID=1491 RepID=A0A846K4D8_CLOBO|nr:hypothetical protein [Clostridium botulinum]NFN36422.1 hypothetical protein [Clostridium botulinum]